MRRATSRRSCSRARRSASSRSRSLSASATSASSRSRSPASSCRSRSTSASSRRRSRCSLPRRASARSSQAAGRPSRRARASASLPPGGPGIRRKVGRPVRGSNSMAAQAAPSISSAAAASSVRWVVITAMLPRSSRPSTSAIDKAAPSAGSVPEPSSSSSTRLSGAAASQASRSRSSRPLKVERSASRSWSSPTVATRAPSQGTRLPAAAGIGSPHWAARASRPMVLSATVLPPAFGPVITRTRRAAASSTSSGTIAPRWPGCPRAADRSSARRGSSSGWRAATSDSRWRGAISARRPSQRAANRTAACSWSSRPRKRPCASSAGSAARASASSSARMRRRSASSSSPVCCRVLLVSTTCRGSK